MNPDEGWRFRREVNRGLQVAGACVALTLLLTALLLLVQTSERHHLDRRCQQYHFDEAYYDGRWNCLVRGEGRTRSAPLEQAGDYELEAYSLQGRR